MIRGFSRRGHDALLSGHKEISCEVATEIGCFMRLKNKGFDLFGKQIAE